MLPLAGKKGGEKPAGDAADSDDEAGEPKPTTAAAVGSDESDGEEGGAGGAETKGQMVQRHKKVDRAIAHWNPWTE